MIPVAHLPLGAPCDAVQIPINCLFPYEIGLDWEYLHLRFGTLAVSAHWPFGTLVPSGDGTRGLPLPNGGCPWDSSGPGLSLLSSLPSSSISWLLLQRGGGCCDPPFCPGLYSPRAHYVCPFRSSAPLRGWGDPWSDLQGLSPSSGQFVLHRILMTILSGPCLEFPHC